MQGSCTKSLVWLWLPCPPSPLSPLKSATFWLGSRMRGDRTNSSPPCSAAAALISAYFFPSSSFTSFFSLLLAVTTWSNPRLRPPLQYHNHPRFHSHQPHSNHQQLVYTISICSGIGGSFCTFLSESRLAKSILCCQYSSLESSSRLSNTSN